MPKLILNANSDFSSLNLDSHFQPIYSIAHRRTIGLEALLRAYHQHNYYAPRDIYTVLPEEKICAFDLKAAQVHIDHFKKLERPNQWLFLNIHPLNISTPELTKTFIQKLLSLGLPPHTLVLEFLESHLSTEPHILDSIHLLKKTGFMISVDDFGFNHSNFDQISLILPDIVKFDPSVLRRAVHQQRTRNLLKRLVQLMHEMGAMVVEKGVETEADIVIALDSGCDFIQGYYIARPLEKPETDSIISPRIDTKWDELMTRELLKRKITRRQLELSRQAFVQSAIALIQGRAFIEAAEPMILLPDVIRCFLLDHEGRQIGKNLNRHSLQTGNPRFLPLSDATGAVWSRRAYFQHAIDQPGVLYVSDPYLSMTDTRSCVTLSMAIEIEEVLHVLCADVLFNR